MTVPCVGLHKFKWLYVLSLGGYWKMGLSTLHGIGFGGKF